MVEPLEETRSELIFATEPILSSLELSIPSSGRYSPLVELDEVEVRRWYHWFRRVADASGIIDTKRDTADMQRPFILALICSVNPLKHMP